MRISPKWPNLRGQHSKLLKEQPLTRSVENLPTVPSGRSKAGGKQKLWPRATLKRRRGEALLRVHPPAWAECTRPRFTPRRPGVTQRRRLNLLTARRSGRPKRKQWRDKPNHRSGCGPPPQHVDRMLYRRRERYFWISGAFVVVMIGGIVGINIAPPRSGLSFLMGGVIGFGVTGALLMFALA